VGRSVSGSQAVADIQEGGGSPEIVLGKADLTVVILTDYQCPACRSGNLALGRAIRRDGNIRLVYKDWPLLGDRSTRAAKVALAARSQGIYPQVHDRLMAATSLDDAALRTAIIGAGGDWERLEAELMEDGLGISGQLAANRSDAFALGLQGTPGYLIGPILVEGAATEEEFLRAFRQARAAL
jgi:protein-disulfide isomerase